MRKLLIIAAFLLAAPATAQVADKAPGFFDRLFGSDNAETDEDQGSFLGRMIEDNLSGAGRSVAITGFAGALQGRATIDRMTIADDEGVWLTLTDAVLDWNRMALLRGHLEIAEISAAEILLLRLARTGEANAPKPEASGFGLPELPVSIEIGSIAAKRLFVGEQVFGTEVSASMQGSLALEGGEGAADLIVQRLDEKGSLTLDVSYANATGILGLDLSLEEEADGIFANIVNLPGLPSVAFSIKGEEPVTEFVADLRLGTNGIERLAGSIATQPGRTEGEHRLNIDIGGDIAPVFAPDYRPFFGGDIGLTADITQFPDGRIFVADLSLMADNLKLRGSANLAADKLPQDIKLRGTIAAGDARPVLLPLPGAATYVDRVDLNLGFDSSKGDDWTGRFRMKGLDRDGFKAKALTLEGTGQIVAGSANHVNADLTFDAVGLDFGGQEINEAVGERVVGKARIDWTEGDTVHITRLQADGDNYGLDGKADVAIGEHGPSILGGVLIKAERLSQFSGLVGRKIGGAAEVDSTFVIDPFAGSFDATAIGWGNDLSVDQRQADRILAGKIRLDLTAVRAEDGIRISLRTLETPTANVSGTATLASGGSKVSIESNVTDAGLLITDLTGPVRLKIEGKEDVRRDWAIQAEIAGDDLQLSVRGELLEVFDAPHFDGRVEFGTTNLAAFSSLAGRPLSGGFDLAGDVRTAMNLSDLTVVADVLGDNLQIGQPEVDRLMSGKLTTHFEASGSARNLHIKDLEVVTPAMSASASGLWSDDNSQLNLKARLADVSPFAAGITGPLSVQGQVDFGGVGEIAIDLAANGPAGAQAKAMGILSSDFTSAALALKGAVPLGLVNRFIAPRAISGTVGFDLRLDGKPSLPSISGTITTSHARLVAPRLGISLSNIVTNTTLAGGRADLSMTGAVKGGGSLSMEGPINLSAPFDANLDLKLQRVALSDPRLFETTIDGRIAINGPLAGGARLTGGLKLGETNIRIPSSGLGGAGAVGEVLHIKEPPPVRSTRQRAGLIGGSLGEAKTTGGSAYPLDITIDALNKIFIRGRGLDSEIGGQLRLTGTTATPIPLGGFELIRGRMDILGRRLQLDEARVTMQGSFEPFLDLRASTQAEEFQINVNVIGPASDPEITFTSIPNLPQEEVLARLIFGRGLETLSAFQAAQLAVAVRTLTGQGGEGIVSRIRSATGLADLDVTTDENGNAALRAGAYLSDNIYTDVTVDSGGETKLNLNLDLSPSITVKGGVTNEGVTSLGIFFERDY